MSSDFLFFAANTAAVLGWLVLGYAVLRRNDWLRDQLAGRWLPLAFAGFYSVLIFFFYGRGPGGFGSVGDVQALFTSPWMALAGWVHYLAFDLFIGVLIARRVMAAGLPRFVLLVLLPATFLFGPVGLLLSEITLLALRPRALAAPEEWLQ
ncbi:MAG: DUF4281 domain-containing protein [Rhizobiales bacterium]|nr:DUF4281 domain-containing protein [Hyphomicrobiales bacterium]